MQGPSETYVMIQGDIVTCKKGWGIILAFISNKYILGNAGSH